ncbi:predicted protein [Nematostella vectensis]|uniref:Uncharacterized protein n=1 Tax=Nematostella vectensis TaxID=45351 RepID=A7RXQ5_NEMVE|nr:predicted protein [Nematostella vectensis]|eukprot:XP_001635946.1 predicted protein [Nematostella vectensis]
MGAIVSTIRDIKTIMRDLKVTLKYTSKVVLKLHAIVDDVENTVQDLKNTVRSLTVRVANTPPLPAALQYSRDSTCYDSSASIDSLLQSVENKADSVKSTVATAVGGLVNDDLLKTTLRNWETFLGNFSGDVPSLVRKWASVSDELGAVSKDMDRLVHVENRDRTILEACQQNQPRLLSSTPLPPRNEENAPDPFANPAKTGGFTAGSRDIICNTRKTEATHTKQFETLPYSNTNKQNSPMNKGGKIFQVISRPANLGDSRGQNPPIEEFSDKEGAVFLSVLLSVFSRGLIARDRPTGDSVWYLPDMIELDE